MDTTVAPTMTPVAADPPRPGWITAAAVILLTIGTLSGLITLFFVVFGFAFGGLFNEFSRLPGQFGENQVPPGFFESFGRTFTIVFVAFGVIGALWTTGHIAAGVGLLRRRGWARILGMVLAVIGAALGILGLLWMIVSFATLGNLQRDPRFSEVFDDPPFGGAGSAEFYATYSQQSVALSIVMSLLFILPFVVGYLLALIALIRNGGYFSWTASAPGSTL